MTKSRAPSLTLGIVCLGALSTSSCIEPPLPTVADIQVEFPGMVNGEPALLLYSGREAADCDTFAAHIAAPTVTLNDVTNDPTCPVEIDVFAPNLGTYIIDVDPAVPGGDDWLDNAIASGTMAIPLPPMTRVPLRLWLVTYPSDLDSAEKVRDRLLDKAFPVYAVYGTGLTFDTASTAVLPDPLIRKCDQAGAISQNPAIYESGKINIYFIAHYGTPYLTNAWNCWEESHPEIVFISFKNHNVTDPTLAHELGHALGLIHPASVGGHTYAVPGFDPFNLMATNSDVTNVTLGQIYSLNFSTDAWINRAGSTIGKPVTRTCDDTWEAVPCASLKLTKSGWPP